jgi:hypothetical protein
MGGIASLPPSRAGRLTIDATTGGLIENCPVRNTNADGAEIVADARFNRMVERVYRHGPRVIAELLAEIGAAYMNRTDIERRLERYAGLDPAALELTGGGAMPPTPLSVITSATRMGGAEPVNIIDKGLPP